MKPPARVSIPARFAMSAIRVYQVAIAPLLPPLCRYEPSCSRYAMEALRTHGFFRGMWLACGRILRCQPFGRGGHDPVPPPPRPAGH